jgi:hypothetical protein
VLPAFAHARRNSSLVAVVSGDRTKRREIAKRYRLDGAFSYEQFDECLRLVDAVEVSPEARSIRARTPVLFGLHSERPGAGAVGRGGHAGRADRSSAVSIGADGPTVGDAAVPQA